MESERSSERPSIVERERERERERYFRNGFGKCTSFESVRERERERKWRIYRETGGVVWCFSVKEDSRRENMYYFFFLCVCNKK